MKNKNDYGAHIAVSHRGARRKLAGIKPLGYEEGNRLIKANTTTRPADFLMRSCYL